MLSVLAKFLNSFDDACKAAKEQGRLKQRALIDPSGNVCAIGALIIHKNLALYQQTLQVRLASEYEMDHRGPFYVGLFLEGLWHGFDNVDMLNLDKESRYHFLYDNKLSSFKNGYALGVSLRKRHL